VRPRPRALDGGRPARPGGSPRTTRGNLFCADTVRDMVGNLTYCDYVTAQRSTSKEVRGKHQPLVSEELFNFDRLS
jgi:hypothetical protein